MTAPWVLSAPSRRALRDRAVRLRRKVEKGEAGSSDAAGSLTSKRPDRAHRAVLLPQGDDWLEPLTAVVEGRPSSRVVRGVATDDARPVFVFPGQGTVFPGMCVGLLEASPEFARRIGECADALAPHVDWSLVDVLRGEGPAQELQRPDVVEPVLFSIMVALAGLWRSHGVEPGGVVGFSLGEIAAACVTGALPLDEAARIAVLWSRAHVPMVGQGGMAMVGLTVEEVRERFGARGTDSADAIDVAGVFDPRSVVIAGADPVIDGIVESLRDEGTYAQKLSVEFPAHSPRVEPQREALLASLGRVRPRTTELPFYSSTTGGRVDTAELDAEFWYRNLRNPVMYEQAARAVLADGHRALVELSAHPVLVRPTREIVAAIGDHVPVIGTLRRDRQGPARFVASLAEAWVHGVPVDWSRPLPRVDDGTGPAAPADPVAEDRALVDAIVSYVVGELESRPSEAAALDPALREANLFDLGLDSVRLVSLQAKLERRLDVRMESTCIIDHPEPAALVEEIRRTRAALGGAQAKAPAPRPSRAPAPAEPSDAIAIVGMGMRLPGGIADRRRLWEVLSGKIDVVEPVPEDRWAHSPLDVSEVTTTQGGYLRDIDRFDPTFFAISPSEAELIDPQQRLLLELTWEAFEDAGLDPYAAGAAGRVGTFVGIYNNDYRQVGQNLGYSHEAYTYTGNMANAAAGRISYTFGFQGPSMAVDTACSSSLYALHLGGRELKQGGCDLVVAAGVNLILSPEGHLSWSRLGALSPSGRCRSFDDGADGYIRSEGGVVVLLKRLADAERDGDDVLAVLRGSAVSHNGRSGGFTVPSGAAQSQVIRDAMAEAGVGAEDVSYVEAHGSGTPIGDPQEINSLARVFAGRTAKVGVGSVKSNLGHLESAAGMAALCKVVTSLQNRRLPATLHFRSGNRLIDWDSAPLEVITEEVPWDPPTGRRVAGISSFGVSGTNAHVIVEEYGPRRREPVPPRTDVDTPRLLPVSANSAAALRTGLRELADWSSGVAVDLDDVAHTLSRRRGLKYRKALVCTSLEELRTAAASPSGEKVAADPRGAGPVFVFSGQGTQYQGMARGLYDHAEGFRRELDELDREFRRVADISVLEVMFAEEADERFQSPLYTQPMIFAVGLALARYWVSCGVTPAAVIGHSIGEYAAACFAGAMSREQAVELVAHRARVVADSSADGAMATLLCSVERARELLTDTPDVSLAAVNATENVTVSGPADSLAAVLKAARRQRVFTERLEVSHPFHSERMTPAAERLRDRIREWRFNAPSVKWISAQTARPVTPGSPVDADHWSRHMVEPVLFRDAVASVVRTGLGTFVEIGATATLGGLIAQEFGDDVVVLPSLRKDRSDPRQFLESAGRLWELGAELDPGRIAGAGRLLRDLPHTPFDRQRIWYRDRTGAGDTTMGSRVDDLATTGTAENGPADGFAAKADAAAADARRADEEKVVGEVITQALSEVTGVATTELNPGVELFSLGVDSLMLVQFGKRIEKHYALDIPITTFFESLHTVGQVTDFVLRNRPEPEPPPEPDPRPNPPPGAVPDQRGSAVPPVPTTAPAAGQGVPSASGLEAVVHSQLAVMQQQLQMLGGAAPGAGAIGAPTPQTAPEPAPKRRPARTPRKVGTYDNNISLSATELTTQQERFITDFVARYTARTAGSQAYARSHRRHLADWINSLNFDTSLKEVSYPLVSSRSRGAEFWDVDGNRYVDTGIGYGVHFFGHQPDFVVRAVQEQLEAGYELGPQNRVAGEVAELIHDMTGAERVAFCNTGTEAVMVSLRLARAVSGRDRIVRFTDSYHGGSDAVLAESDGTDSVPLTIGIPPAMIENTVVLRYGAEESLERIRQQGDELAAVLVEPVQSRNPGLQPAEFLRELRQICTEHGIALIFDEMIVGFRLELGGAQTYFGVESDMSLYGKLVGGGMPVGIVAGKSTYLDAVDGGAFSDVDDSRPAVPTTFFAGTFCKHPLTMAACRAVLTTLKESGEERIAELNRFTDDFVRRANDFFDREEVPIRLTHCASMYKYENVAPRDVAMMTLTTNLFFKLLAHHGVFVWERRSGYFSWAHTEEHKDRILEAFGAVVREIRAGGFDFRRSPSAVRTGEGGTDDGGTLAAAQGTPVTMALSAEEKRVYVNSRMRGGNEAYQVPLRLHFDGRLDPSRVDAAFRAIARRHPKLRSRYEVDSDDVVCRVLPDVEPEVHLFEGASPEEVASAMNAPLDLARAPLWRYGIVVGEDGTDDLVVSFHHIIVDGRGLELIVDELADHLTNGRLTSTEEPADYAEYVRTRSELPGRSGYEEHRRWWLREFETLPPPLAVPTDAPLPAINDFSGHHYYTEIDPRVHKAATAVIHRHRTTPFLFYLSLWSVLLARTSGESDLCVGVPLDQRALGPFGGTVGMFAQSLPLRLRPTPETRLSDYLRRVRDTGLAAIEHAHYPYETLIEELDLERDYGRNALFDTMFIYTNARERARRFGELNATTEDFGMSGSMLALTLELTERDGGLFVDLNHSGVFSEQRIAGLMERFHALVARAVENPDLRIGEIPLIDDDTTERLLSWGTGQRMTGVPGLAEQFDRAFTAYATRPAIRFQGEVTTYDRLAERAGRLAALLRGSGVGKGDLVGLLLPRSPELVAAMLAVHRVGAAWLPMEVTDPPDRLRSVIEAAEPAKVLCSPGTAVVLQPDGAEGSDGRVLTIRDRDLPAASVPAPTTEEPDDLAYTIFTSGSTGRPKGVMVTNGSLANFLWAMPKALGWRENATVACLTTPSFDIHLLETLMTLVTGGTVAMADERDTGTPAAIAEFVTDNGVAYLQMTPSRLRMLCADPDAARTACEPLEKLVVGGEAFPEDLLPDLWARSSCQIFNVYGPTETCIWSSVKELTRQAPVTIGTPIANTTFYVLDDDLQLVPEGTEGDLWIGGHGVSPGYLHRPELTREAFRDDPFGEGRIYRSGDRALWRDGEVHCLGRADNQVKVRGYRIELEEIEQALAEHGQVAGAGVIVDEVSPGNRVIRGFYEVKGEAQVEPESLRDFLSRKLPGYMVPATLTAVAALPMTTSGKIDRPTLARMEAAPPGGDRADAPSAVNEDLLMAWKAVLGDVSVSPDESFFDLGGNSFSLILLLEKLNAAFPGELDVSDLFARPTLGGQQELLERRLARRHSDGALTGTGVRLPETWFVQDQGADGTAEVALPARVRAALHRHGTGGDAAVRALAHAAFALTVGKTLACDDVTLHVVSGPGRAVPVPLDLVGRTDLAELVDDYLRLVGDTDREVGLDRLHPGRGDDGRALVVCADRRWTEEGGLLRHADLVLGTALTAQPATVTLAHRREIAPEAVHRLLDSYVRLLGLLDPPTAASGSRTSSRAADAIPGHSHVPDRKDQS
ncbi:non-ribosomal peptide synthetase/type I polyketide synthase [Nocardiopsis sp. ATB16-24]|uniref:non-ribosomal peptide synthetase/type I polyketide synthase n=1 Tax=Nocardiopsis sp. ATB16-24 TaxID=3019555 RepID=UPI0025532F4A|nr:non-ribosomal peptide synthetase/type I polyketide synthase [Nocardiopsis sp. ATB16-24]